MFIQRNNQLQDGNSNSNSTYVCVLINLVLFLIKSSFSRNIQYRPTVYLLLELQVTVLDICIKLFFINSGHHVLH